jgi:undecaprenyl-diphosphatase
MLLTSPWKLWTVALFAALTVTAFAYNGLYPPGDLTISRAVQETRGPWLAPLSEAFYRFGLSPVYPVAGLCLSAVIGLRLGITPALFLLGAAALRPFGTVIKEIVERPRPTEESLLFVEGASGYAFPSGHVFGTVLFIGFLWFLVYQSAANSVQRVIATAAAGLFLLLMGLQRVYAGAHWPSDVIGAYLWGGLVLFLVIQLYLLCSRRRAAGVDFQQPHDARQHQNAGTQALSGVLERL